MPLSIDNLKRQLERAIKQATIAQGGAENLTDAACYKYITAALKQAGVTRLHAEELYSWSSTLWTGQYDGQPLYVRYSLEYNRLSVSNKPINWGQDESQKPTRFNQPTLMDKPKTTLEQLREISAAGRLQEDGGGFISCGDVPPGGSSAHTTDNPAALPGGYELVITCGSEEGDAVLTALKALVAAGAQLTCRRNGEDCDLSSEPEAPVEQPGTMEVGVVMTDSPTTSV